MKLTQTLSHAKRVLLPPAVHEWMYQTRKSLEEEVSDRAPIWLAEKHYELIGLPAEIAQHRAACAQFGVPDFATFDLEKAKKSDTLFILGSGASINAIEDSRWDVIRKHDSIGFNYWHRHDFVPSLYVFEGPKNVPYDANGKLYGSIVKYREIAFSRAEAYKNVPKIVRNITFIRPDHNWLADYPAEWRQNLYAIRDVRIRSRNEQELRRFVAWGVDHGCFERTRHADGIWRSHMGSLVTMVVLAIRMGYRRIVLCGIDLRDGAYYFNDRARYPDMAGFREPTGAAHPTFAASPKGHVSVDGVLSALNDLVMRPAGIELVVENPSSALVPHFRAVDEATWEQLKG